MRCPYGRGWQFSIMARPFAERGYHVLLQSVRGTFGSGGTFMPGTCEAADGQDTVAWLRTQDWFNGRLATVGASYLAFVQWALAAEPPKSGALIRLGHVRADSSGGSRLDNYLQTALRTWRYLRLV
jgi:putative CocE/NonD family hydrolase